MVSTGVLENVTEGPLAGRTGEHAVGERESKQRQDGDPEEMFHFELTSVAHSAAGVKCEFDPTTRQHQTVSPAGYLTTMLPVRYGLRPRPGPRGGYPAQDGMGATRSNPWNHRPHVASVPRRDRRDR